MSDQILHIFSKWKFKTNQSFKRLSLIIHLILALVNLRSRKMNVQQNPDTFLFIDTTLPSKNAFRFWKNLLEEVKRTVMTIKDKIREKLQYDTNRAAAKIPTSPSGRIVKYEYLTGEETMPLRSIR